MEKKKSRGRRKKEGKSREEKLGSGGRGWREGKSFGLWYCFVT